MQSPWILEIFTPQSLSYNDLKKQKFLQIFIGTYNGTVQSLASFYLDALEFEPNN